MASTFPTRRRSIPGVAVLGLAAGMIAGVVLAQMPTLELNRLAPPLVQTVTSQLAQTEVAQPARTSPAAPERSQRGLVPSSLLPAGQLAMDPKGPYLRPIAAVLGLAPGQLLADLWAGNSLAEVAQAHGKSRADLKRAILVQVESLLQQAVDEDRLSSGRAAVLRIRLEADLDPMIDSGPAH